MKEFLEGQKSKIEEELKQLYIDRGRAGVETEGSYDNIIGRKKRELAKLVNDLDGAGNTETRAGHINSKTDITSLIAQDKIEEAIQKLMNSTGDNQLILLFGRYNRIKKQNDSGTISQADYSIEINKITNSLLSILNDL